MFNWAKIGVDINQARGGKVACPFCSAERRNSRERCMSVDKEKGGYHCHHCGKHGSVIDPPMNDKPKKEYAKPEPRLTKVGPGMEQWFLSRGISNNTLLIAKVSESSEFIPANKNNPGGVQPVICFNYFRDEVLVNIKFRGEPKGFMMVKDAELIFYNLDCLKTRQRKFVVIVEGEIDALTLIECDIHSVISVPAGASKGNKLEYLDNCWQDLEGIEKIVVMTDDDEPGQMLKAELIRRLGNERCYTVRYPAGCKDANEILLKLGKQAVVDTVMQAQQCPLEGVVELSDFESDLDNIFENGYPQTVGLDWKMDANLKFRGGELTVITGIPNHGKTPFMLNLVIGLAKKHGWRFGVFCPENMPAPLLVGMMIQIFVGQWFYRANPQERMSREQYEEAKNFVHDHFFFVDSENLDYTIEDLLEVSAKMVKRIGIRGFVTDPWNMIEHHIPKGRTEHDFIGEKLGLVTKHAKKFNVHHFIVAHPTKLVADVKTKRLPVPNLYNISGSSHWYNKANNGITVYRNFDTNRTEIYITKVKWFFVGKVGMVEMVFESAGQRFVDAPEQLSIEQETYEEKLRNMKMGERNRQNVMEQGKQATQAALSFLPYHEPPEFEEAPF